MILSMDDCEVSEVDAFYTRLETRDSSSNCIHAAKESYQQQQIEFLLSIT